MAKQRKMNPKSLANLKPVKPGERRNPSGRPKGSISLWARIQREMRRAARDGDDKGIRNAELAARKYVSQVVAGAWPQTKEYIDREEGPTPTAPNTGTIRVEVVYTNAPPVNGNGRISHADDTN